MPEAKKKEKGGKQIRIRGARIHNLKNINLDLPRNKLTVITGLSGSGKSSLAFDTLFAEGQRRYVESLSSYARQFLGRMEKPDVDRIDGLSPAIAIEQKVNSKNPRSTVGTTTEIYDYLKLLFARIGKTFSPVSGEEVKRHSVSDVMQYLLGIEEGARVQLIAAHAPGKQRSVEEHLKVLIQQGFSRVRLGDETVLIEDVSDTSTLSDQDGKIHLVIDRFKVVHGDDDFESRAADSIETAFYEGNGQCYLFYEQKDKWKEQHFSNRFELDGMQFEEPSVHLFSFNNPYGACRACEGFGTIIGIDEALVIPDQSLSVYDDAVICWRGEKMSKWKDRLIMSAYKSDFPIHKAYQDMTEAEKDVLWNGNKDFKGIYHFFKYLEEKSYKIQYRVMLARYRGKTVCTECKGSRLRQEALFIKVNDRTIRELVNMPIGKLRVFFADIRLNENETNIARRILKEINSRLEYLDKVGLSYLTLNRPSVTLSGGESQRINLATSLGSSLVGSMYILDEPSIGLHPRDTEKLISVLQSLRDLENTVIVVEHDEEIMRSADRIVDLGPGAGYLGGKVVFEGDHNALLTDKESITTGYLTGRLQIEAPKEKRQSSGTIQIIGCRENNLKNIDVSIPLGVLTVVTGVSGSGKSSLVKTILYPAMLKQLGGYAPYVGQFTRLGGDMHRIGSVEFVDQNPIGKSSRSNPVTYVKAYDEIRALYASQPLSKMRGYTPAYFSFNVDGGRCEECKGEGEVTVEMQFMADIHLVCESCNGKRFREEILEVNYHGKDIRDILELTVDEAVDFFSSVPKPKAPDKKIVDKLMPLKQTGLGYVKLGQSSNTLSGGEAQRIKLASFLSKGAGDGNTLFIFDEPTTGLHFHDINKLLNSFYALLENGHSVVVIEHHPDVIKCASHVIDLGPEGGEEGGTVIFEGTPEGLAECEASYTGRSLKGKI
ncbi:MAG: excinuclease ABC subunit UvrA [Flavobacteriales bacterium]|nr:excinuclease ABC subunit UvrA [Flavobacteriales bacterium]